jgi:hypothetical protein
MTTITPAIRFAAYAMASRLATAEARYTARRPSLVEGFPTSYPADLVERAEALLVRLADAETGGGTADLVDRSLWADLVAFSEAVEAAR